MHQIDIEPYMTWENHVTMNRIIKSATLELEVFCSQIGTAEALYCFARLQIYLYNAMFSERRA